MTISANTPTRVVVLLTSISLALVLLLAGAKAASAADTPVTPTVTATVEHTVVVGDTLWFEMADGRRHLYRVSGIDVVDARRASLVIDTDDPVLSLVTCYPFDRQYAGSPLRYVVSAQMVF